jgi:WD40 repeat protein
MSHLRARRVWMMVAPALLAACWSGADRVAVAQDLRPKVTADRDKPGVQSDWKWLHGEATAFLVLEPPPLKGVGRWAIESPRHRGAIHALAVSPDGTRAATGGVDGVIRIWNLETGGFERALVSHRYHLYKLVWSPDGRKLASHGWGDAKTRVWDVDTGKQLVETKSIGNLTALAFSPDSRHLAAGNYGSGHVYVSSELADYKLLVEMGTTVRLIEWFPDGSRIGRPMALRQASAERGGS